MSRGFVLELLDPDQGEALQTWELDGGTEISIGRARECDIQVGSKYVSRLHARIVPKEVGWMLIAESSQGVLIDEMPSGDQTLDDGAVLRLGSAGPMLRFKRTPDKDFAKDATIVITADEMKGLQLDEQERDREVAEVVESDFFQELKEKAEALRRGRFQSGE